MQPQQRIRAHLLKGRERNGQLVPGSGDEHQAQLVGFEALLALDELCVLEELVDGFARRAVAALDLDDRVQAQRIAGEDVHPTASPSRRAELVLRLQQRHSGLDQLQPGGHRVA